MTALQTFLTDRFQTGGFTTEDTLASILPLMREVVEAHAAGAVAPLEGLSELSVEGVRIWFEEAKRKPVRNHSAAIRRIQAVSPSVVEIVVEARQTRELDEGTGEVSDLSIGDRDSEITRPVYLAGYVTWEHALEHHDPVTDIFSLGMLLASMTCGLDFAEPADLRRFVAHRRNLFALNPELHPVLAQAIVRMTELDRHRRAQDLTALVRALENYREQEVDLEFDLARAGTFAAEDNRTRQHVVLRKLRERLFEISRRNRLLHFRATMQTVNLTHASVPLTFDIQNIRPDQILVWNDALHEKIVAQKPISLNSHLNFSEAIYLPSVLDRILAEARRDEAEFGFAQLRLAVCFLHWANLKEQPAESLSQNRRGLAHLAESSEQSVPVPFSSRGFGRGSEYFESPLVLLPVKPKKKKGIRDTYTLEAISSEAEINPVIRHQFRELYDIDLPEAIDLSATRLEEFFEFLSARIRASEPAVTLSKIDRPRIALIHEKARRRLDQYRRRARLAGRGVRSFLDLDYSYDPANYHPLGITLYSAKIRTPGSHLRSVIEEKPRARTFAAPPPEEPVVEKERTFYSIQQGGEENPYHWSFDLCSVTLANFKYRKMSLVRDYETLLAEPPANPAFEAIFSLSPRPVERELPPSPALDDRYDVVPCDPTQAAAIEEAHLGKSYIIQGPPGTGKSQTIANLIADYVARGKRVLFLCEKRAAIDVVYARLRQRGLGSLCSLIHDSQTDKREFLMDLKQTYEEVLAGSEKRPNRNRRRDQLLEQLKAELRPLEEFDAAMQQSPPGAAVGLRRLLDRCIELRGLLPELTPVEKERLPSYAQWRSHRDRIHAFAASAKDIQPDGILSRHPLSLLSPRLAEHERPLELILSAAEAAERLFDRVEAAFSQSGVAWETWQTIARARALVEYAERILPIARIGQMAILDRQDEAARKFDKAAAGLRRRQQALAEARKVTKYWRNKLPAADLPLALEQARALEATLLAWLKPSWWRLRAILNRSYDFQAHAIRPTWTSVLSSLEAEYTAAADLEKHRRRMADTWQFDGDVDEAVAEVRALREAIPALPDWLKEILATVAKSGNVELVAGVAAAKEPLWSLNVQLEKILEEFQERQLDRLRQDLRRAMDSLDRLPDFLRCVAELAQAPPPLAAALRRLPLTPAVLEAAVADHSLREALRSERTLHRFDGTAHARHVGRLESLYEGWLQSNAAEICERAQRRFLENVRLAGAPATQLGAEQKEFKRRYSRGRRDLEHEFGKSMRFRAIRDLVSSEPGDVVKDLKPVWLMSPLSVSDTLPMNADLFDVVIFDEASQVTLEEAVPSIFRSRQTIVVGDEMQLPPTNFFSAKRVEDEDELLIEEAGELIQYDLDSDSLLNHAAKNLPATMLGWHYRSRSESLISFSNWAFYDGRLLTVPEERLAASRGGPLTFSCAADAESGAAGLLDRSVSFHFLQHGVYDKRSNRTEAEYIAHLVRSLLTGDCGLSIGIVAFSEAQQGEIESALERLAQEDSAFGPRLDAEREREVDGQFVGLLVKNLENIQGDERDVIVLSICYGYGPSGRMLMNFGPINKSGGEKRLNVAFSRAKHHMAVVSSIRSSDITNDYNDGANCLKNYLRYAEAVSSGDIASAQRVLRGMSRWQDGPNDGEEPADPVVEQIAAALADCGLHVDRSIGQSHFRCDLAVCRPGDEGYRLGILVDTASYYEQPDILERDMMRPKLLRDFGWTTAFVLAKDWYEDRQRVLDRLLRLVGGRGELRGQHGAGPCEFQNE